MGKPGCCCVVLVLQAGCAFANGGYVTSGSGGYATINPLFAPQETKPFAHHARPDTGGEYFSQTLVDEFDASLKKPRATGGYDRIFGQ